ncbi:MAG: hypothetical protein AUK35_05135 [Zetaproteobacteria bacterium CG2_30_46_52]|nr:MAG: hypothetical protein AUK35_05135 [Zetaproteobacteria bacterium CG2_30_46_52]
MCRREVCGGVMMFRVGLFLLTAVALSSCSDGLHNQNNSTSTEVTISFAGHLATRDLQGEGVVPSNVKSISLQAYNSGGASVFGPKIANAPDFILKYQVPNGNQMQLRILAFDGLNGSGHQIYQGKKTVNLTGAPITVPVVMSLSVAVSADTTQVVRGGSVNLSALVGGVAPTASSPIVWSASTGSLSGNVWTASTIGMATITAAIDATVNPDQDASAVGTIQIQVVNQAPSLSLSSSAVTVVGGVANNTVVASASDLDGDSYSFALGADAPTWASIAADGKLSLTPAISNQGSYTLSVTAVDQFGASSTPQLLAVTVVAVPMTVSGSVRDVLENPLANVLVSFVDSGGVVAGVVTDVYGNYTANVYAGNFALTATATGYIDAVLLVNVIQNNQVLSTIPMTLASTVPGSITGSVIDSTNSQPIPVATVDMRAGINTTTGTIVASTTTTSGVYTFSSLTAGTYTATVTATGFAQAVVTLVVEGGSPTTAADIFMSPTLQANQYRVVASWGSTPSDLDAHLTGPRVAGEGANRFHVHYGARGSASADPYAILDNDVTSGLGPETITINQLTSGIYHYYLFNFSDGGTDTLPASTLSGQSNAVVKVYSGTNPLPLAVYNVPVSGDGDTWHVFDLDGATGVITPINQILPTITAVPARVISYPSVATTIAINEVLQAYADLETLEGYFNDITNTVSWVSSNPSVATVDAYGAITGMSVGTATITALDSASSYVSVLPISVTLDTMAPSITTPSSISLTAAAAGGAPISEVAIQAFLNAASATDNVDGVVTVTNDAPLNFPIGVTTVTFSAVDAASNLATTAATVTVNAPVPVLNLSMDANGLAVGAVVNIYAQVLDGYGGLGSPVANTLVQFAVQTSPYATFAQNSTQLLDVYTDVSGIAWASVQDIYAETFPVQVSAPSLGLTQSVNITFASNAGPSTVISSINANNSVSGVLCNQTWTQAHSPYWLQSSVTIAAGCRLQIDPNVVVKGNASTYIYVDGVLDVYGSSVQPVVFTSIHDDTVGGDLNANSGSSTPAPGQWGGIYYQSGSSGTINWLETRYAQTGFYIRNASPALNDVLIADVASQGLSLIASTGDVTSPIVTNLTLNNTGNSNYGLSFSATGTGSVINPILTNVTINHGLGYQAIYMSGSAGTVVTPTFNGVNTINTASTSYAAIQISGAGVNPVFNGFTINGGQYNVYAFDYASGTFTGNILDGASLESVYLANSSNISMDATNILSNAPAPLALGGQSLPAGVSPTFGAGLVDIYSLHLTGTFAADTYSYILGPNPLGAGSVWQSVGNVTVASGARVQVEPNTVIKFGPSVNLLVSSGGKLDVYGAAGNKVVFTSVNDDTIAGIIPGSTGIPAAGNWGGVDFQNGSFGSINFADIRYAVEGVYIYSASPTLSNVTIEEISSQGIYLYALTGQTTSPVLSNITINNTGSFRYGLYIQASGAGAIANPIISNLTVNHAASYQAVLLRATSGGSVAPIFSGINNVTSASTTYPAIYMEGAGVNPAIDGLVVSGGLYNVQAITGSAGVFTNCTFDGAVSEALYLGGNSNPVIDNSNIISNTPAPFVMGGQTLPLAVAPVIGAGIVDTYSLHLTGGFVSDVYSYVLSPEPLGVGTIWRSVGNINIANDATVQINPNTVMKFGSGHNIYVNAGGTLDIYGGLGAEVVLTSINDDAYGAILPGSTGVPAAGNWAGIDYQSGSFGSVQNTLIRYAVDGLYLTNASPALTNVNIHEYSSQGVYMNSSTGQTTSPIVNNLTINGSGSFRYGLYLYGGGNGIVSPIFNNLSINHGLSYYAIYMQSAATSVVAPVFTGTNQIVSSSTTYPAIYMLGAGVNVTMDSFSVSGGSNSIHSLTGATGVFTNNTFDGAFNEALYLENNSTISIDASNVVSNASAPYLLGGQALPTGVNVTMGAGISDVSSIHITGSFAADVYSYVLAANPLGGSSVWQATGNINIASGARVEVQPNTVIKFGASANIYVNSGGTLDVYGALGAEVIFTSIHDDYAGATLAVSTGLPAAGNWGGIDYQAGSLGSIAHAQIRYPVDSLDIVNASPVITDVSVIENASHGVYLHASTNQVTSPTINNLSITNATNGRYGLYMYAAGAGGVVSPTLSNINIQHALSYQALYMSASSPGVVTPTFTGTNSVTTTSTTNEAIYMTGLGVSALMDGFTVTGGSYSLRTLAGATGIFTNNTFDGAANEALFLADNGSVLMDATNTVSHAAAPYLMGGQTLPFGVNVTYGAGLVDTYSLHLTGIFLADPYSYILSPDPLASGNSIWQVVGNVAIQSGASVQVDPYTVMKFGASDNIYVNNGGTFDVYGLAGAEVIFTSVNDDSVGLILPHSTGVPAAGNWAGIDFQSGAAGSVAHTQIRYAIDGLDIVNSSPALSNVSIIENSSQGLYLHAGTNQITSPVVNNLAITNTGSARYGLYLYAAGTGAVVSPVFTNVNINHGASYYAVYMQGTSLGVVTPTFNGVNNITSNSTSYANIYLTGDGTNPMMDNVVVVGGLYNVQVLTGATATFTNNIFDGATNEAIYLANNTIVNMDNTNAISNVSAPIVLVGQSLPAGLSPTLGLGVADVYSVHLTGTFAANVNPYLMQADPLGTGNSQWLQTGTISVASGAVVDVYAGAVWKVKAGTVSVNSGGTFNLLGNTATPVVITSVNDDAYGSIVPGSTGLPVRGQGINLTYSSGSSGAIQGLHDRYNTQILIREAIAMSDVFIYDSNLGMSLISSVASPLNQTISNLSIDHWGAGGGSGLIINGAAGSNTVVFTGNNRFNKFTAVHEAIQVTGAGASPTLQNFVVDMHGFAQPAIVVWTGASGLYTNNILRNGNQGFRLGGTLAGWAPGAAILSNNTIVNNDIGIFVAFAPNGTAIENNLIRGSKTNAILVENLLPSQVLIQNNLIVENQSSGVNHGAVRVKSDGVANGPIVTLLSNTIANNTSTTVNAVAGLVVDAYATINARDNIFAANLELIGNTPTDTSIDVAALGAQSNNLSTDLSLPVGGTNLSGTDPFFADNWYLSVSSQAIDAGSSLASVAPFIANQSFAQSAIQDTANLDLGYHHAAAAPLAVDPISSIIVQNVIVPGASGSSTVVFTPLSGAGVPMGAGLQVSATFFVTPSGSLGPVLDNGDGSYQFTYTHAAFSPGSDSVDITVNGVLLSSFVTLTF